jgi:hypothetical protein
LGIELGVLAIIITAPVGDGGSERVDRSKVRNKKVAFIGSCKLGVELKRVVKSGVRV